MTQGDPDLITKTQAPKAKKSSADKLIAMTHASLQLPESDDVASLVLSRQQERKAFLKLVASLGETELRERFPLEAASHSNMKARRRTHGAVIHPEFEDFRPFLLHLGARPVQSYTLDRLDPHDPEYAPGKVAWRDKRSQANNRSNTIMLTVRGETRPLTDWARFRKENPKKFRQRLASGCTHEEVVYGRGNCAPDLPAERAEPAPGAQGYIWPGSQPAKWEHGYRGFVTIAQRHAYLRHYPARTFTRDVFLAWVAGNILAEVSRVLRERYPGYDDPDGDPDYQNPPAALADPDYRVVEVLEQPHDQAMRRLRSDEAAYDLWLHTLRKFPEVRTLPQDWAHVFRNLR